MDLNRPKRIEVGLAILSQPRPKMPSFLAVVSNMCCKCEKDATIVVKCNGFTTEMWCAECYNKEHMEECSACGCKSLDCADGVNGRVCPDCDEEEKHECEEENCEECCRGEFCNCGDNKCPYCSAKMNR